jgi:hypothetical protein
MCRRLVCLLSAVLVLCTAGHAWADLLAHWKLDDGSGTIAKDSAGNFDGVLLNDPTWVSGVLVGALSFDGVDDCVEIGNDPTFNPTGSFSIALWANIGNWATEWEHSPIGNREDGVGWCLRRFGGWWSSQNADLYTMPNSALAFTTRGIGHAVDGTEDTPSNTTPPLNEWIHITCIYDSINSKKYIYFDGEVDAEWDTEPGAALTSATQSVYLGAISNESNTGQQNYFEGMLDDVRFYNHALNEAEVQAAMAGTSLGLAAMPYPADEATDVPRDVTLSWEPGLSADTHNVYFGTDFDDVNSADTDSPLLVGPGLDNAAFNPGRLEFGQTYFWRVDEVNAPPDSTVFPGEIWSFTVETYLYPIPGENITATASSFTIDESRQGPENTINGSGLVGDLHSKDVDAMWLTAPEDSGPAWIQYEFDKIYKLNQMLVWNYNGPSFLAFSGFKEVTVEYSIDGESWTQIPDVTEFAAAPGSSNYAANTIVPFGDVAAKHVRINAISNWSNGLFNQFGLSEVRFLTIPVSAREPNPADEATDVAVDVILSWRAGREADEHYVYISTDEQAIRDGTAPVDIVSQVSDGPLSLVLESTYYWRVDEVNAADVWPSDIWSFATQEYLIVDDFESYNDIEQGEEGSNRVYMTWMDGYDNPAMNGSTIGYVSGESMETDTVHGGIQSVPLEYDNSTASLSEATVSTSNLPIGSDWTLGASETLVLWFHGDPNNAITEQMYIKINDAKVLYDGKSVNIARRRWTQWNIDIASLGINQSNVTSLTIGFERTGAVGGSGTIFVDDIRLYRLAPPVPEAVDPGNSGLIAYYAMENNVQDGSGNGLNGTLVGTPTYVQGPDGYGMAMEFNGTDQCVDLGNEDAFNPAGSLSISLWANIGAWSSSWTHAMVSNRGEGSQGWQVRRYSNNSLCFTTRGVGSDDTPSNTVPPLNEWVHIACVYDNLNNTKRIYINGMEDVMVTTNPGTIGATTHNTYIGARANAVNSSQEARFTGMLDEIRLYNRALTAGEVEFLSDPAP